MTTSPKKEYKGLWKTARVFFIMQAVAFVLLIISMIVLQIAPDDSTTSEAILIPGFLIFLIISWLSIVVSFFAMRMSAFQRSSKIMFWIGVAMLGVVSCFLIIILIAFSMNN